MKTKAIIPKTRITNMKTRKQFGQSLKKKLKRLSGFLLLIFVITLFNCIENRFTDFSLNSYPPESAPHNADWELLLSIYRTCEHDGHQFDYGPNQFDIRIENKSHTKLFEKTYHFDVEDYRRNVLWNVKDTLELKLYSTRYDFDIHDDKDSMLVFSARYVQNKETSNFQEDTVFFTQ
jgi:hypothetical protein